MTGFFTGGASGNYRECQQRNEIVLDSHDTEYANASQLRQEEPRLQLLQQHWRGRVGARWLQFNWQDAQGDND